MKVENSDYAGKGNMISAVGGTDSNLTSSYTPGTLHSHIDQNRFHTGGPLEVPHSPDNYQVGGSHYKEKEIQPWDAMEAWMSAEGFEGFLAGNVIKYMARYRDKDGSKDLKKAQHYLSKLIDHLEKLDKQ